MSNPIGQAGEVDLDNHSQREIEDGKNSHPPPRPRSGVNRISICFVTVGYLVVGLNGDINPLRTHEDFLSHLAGNPALGVCFHLAAVTYVLSS